MPRTYVRRSTGARRVSVTTFLSVINKPGLLYFYGKYGTAEAERIKKESGKNGGIAHDLVERYLKGEPIQPGDAEPKIFAAASKAIDWIEKNEVRPILFEYQLDDDEWEAAGRLDIFPLVRDRLSIVDWKFGKGLYDETAIQLSAYLEMLLRRLRREGAKDPVDEKILGYLEKQHWIVDRYGVNPSIETGEMIDEKYEWGGTERKPHTAHDACVVAFQHAMGLYRWFQKRPDRFIEKMDVKFLEEEL